MAAPKATESTSGITAPPPYLGSSLRSRDYCRISAQLPVDYFCSSQCTSARFASTGTFWLPIPASQLASRWAASARLLRGRRERVEHSLGRDPVEAARLDAGPGE